MSVKYSLKMFLFLAKISNLKVEHKIFVTTALLKLLLNLVKVPETLWSGLIQKY